MFPDESTWCPLEPLGTPWNPFDPLGTPWNPLEPLGTPWNPKTLKTFNNEEALG